LAKGWSGGGYGSDGFWESLPLGAAVERGTGGSGPNQRKTCGVGPPFLPLPQLPHFILHQKGEGKKGLLEITDREENDQIRQVVSFSGKIELRGDPGGKLGLKRGVLLKKGERQVA